MPPAPHPPNTLFVFAMEIEASDQFTAQPCLFTGIGKINATWHLAQRIAQQRPALIVNLGSAGSGSHPRGAVVCCNRFIQRDMQAAALGCKPYETPFSRKPALLQYGEAVPGLPLGTCGSGDSFELSHNAHDYDVVDMEAFALATVAQRARIPFLCLKYISDGADDSAAEDWSAAVHKAAIALKQAWLRWLPQMPCSC